MRKDKQEISDLESPECHWSWTVVGPFFIGMYSEHGRLRCGPTSPYSGCGQYAGTEKVHLNLDVGCRTSGPWTDPLTDRGRPNSAVTRHARRRSRFGTGNFPVVLLKKPNVFASAGLANELVGRIQRQSFVSDFQPCHSRCHAASGSGQ